MCCRLGICVSRTYLVVCMTKYTSVEIRSNEILYRLLITANNCTPRCTGDSLRYIGESCTCQEEFKRGKSPSLHHGKEGDFARTIFSDIYLVHRRSNSGRNFENDEIFPPLNGLKVFKWCKNVVFFYLMDTLLTKQCIFIGKFNTIPSF